MSKFKMQLPETAEWRGRACLALAMRPQGTRIPAKALAAYPGIKPIYFSKTMQYQVAARRIVHSAEGRSGGRATTTLAGLYQSAQSAPVPSVADATLIWLTETGALRGA